MDSGAASETRHTPTPKAPLSRSRTSVAFSNASLSHLILDLDTDTVYPDDELTKSLMPLRPHHISVAPGPAADGTRMAPSSSGHVIATLETIPLSHPPSNTSATNAADALGRDVLAWGLNQQYQLGFGKRGNVNAPAPIHTDSNEGRLMCRVGKEKVKDFDGGVVGKKMNIEQRAVAGPGMSVVYWRIV